MIKKRTEVNFRRVDRLLEDALDTDLGNPWFGQTVEEEDLRTLGGPGSGNFGHVGRKGHVGGSASRETGFTKPDDEFDQMLKEYSFEKSRSEDIFFHGTIDQAIDSIKKNGLVPKGGRGADTWAVEKSFGYPEAMLKRQPAVFMTLNPYTAWRFADYAKEVNPGSDAVVLEIKIPVDRLSKLESDDQLSGAWRSLDRIPPEWIKGRLTKSGELVGLAARGEITVYAVILVKDEQRTLGGPGSGNFGHAGRPGQVGGSAPQSGPSFSGGVDADQFKLHLANFAPQSLIESTAKQIAVVPDKDAAERIDNYLLDHYGFDLRGQAESIVDRDRGAVITTPRAAPAAFARTLPNRFQSDDIKNASRYAGLDAEDAFATSFSNLFAEGQPLYEIAKLPSHLNPGNIALEKLYEVIHSWGWFQ